MYRYNFFKCTLIKITFSGILALGVMLTFISLLGMMATLRHHQVRFAS